jgi:hypothetical protein
MLALIPRFPFVSHTMEAKQRVSIKHMHLTLDFLKHNENKYGLLIVLCSSSSLEHDWTATL